MNRADRERRGRRGEAIAAWYLRLKGWRILDRRIRTPRGEIDLIARRGRVIAFVEVKWRRHAHDLHNAIDPYRLRRVVCAAQDVAARYARAGEDVRIDVILLAPRRFPHHIANATL